MEHMDICGFLKVKFFLIGSGRVKLVCHMDYSYGFGLSLYWFSPYIIISGNSIIPFSIPMYPIYIFFCITVYILGVFLHFTSDMQKYIYLKLNPGNLMTDGMFKK